MLDYKLTILTFIYLLSLYFVLKLSEGKKKYFLFSVLNIGALICFIYRKEFVSNFYTYHLKYEEFAKYKLIFQEVVPTIIVYLVLVVFFFWILKKNVSKYSWFNIYAPFTFIFLYKTQSFLVLMGISYVGFRMAHLAMQVRNRVVSTPGFFQYLSYIFYLPILFVGPISSYSTFIQSLEEKNHCNADFRSALMRIFRGALKVFIYSNIINQLTFSIFWNTFGPHSLLDFIVSSVAYYLYLYLNFSGACDMIIGVSQLFKIKIDENFSNPLKARNLQIFWNSWHITLSTVLRDLVFAPLSKGLVKLLPKEHINHYVAFSIFFVFVLIGAWHGIETHYILFGLMHGLGVIIVHYYTLLLKKIGVNLRLYNSNFFVKSCSVVVTFFYVSISFSLFENNIKDLKYFTKIISLNIP